MNILNKLNFVVSQSDNMSTTMFGEVDINRLIAESDPRNGVKTGFELLDNSLNLIEWWKKDRLVLYLHNQVPVNLWLCKVWP